MVGRSRIPGVPRVDGMEARDTTDTEQHTGISYITQTFVHGQSSRGYTFEVCLFGADRVRSGSSGSQVGEEVVVP